MHMPRVTLYVPDDLKTRMDEAGEAVNWSAVAQRAFTEAVLTHALRKDTSDMTSVVERLRASKERVEETAFASGQDCGRTWAKQSAEYDELERIATFEQGDEEGSLDALCILIDPEREMGQHEWASFLEEHGDSKPSDAFARGFIDGAAEIYNEIADQL
jgi:hypothetical protein